MAMAERVGFEWGDNSRSTLTLLWSCLVTVFACTWTVIHLNMPASYDKFWSIVFRKAYFFLLTLVAPEVTVLVAFQQYLLCIEFTKDMKIIYPYWTRTHSFYAIMGGYVLQFENSASYKYCASGMSPLQFLRFLFWDGVRPSAIQNPAIFRLDGGDIKRLHASSLQPPFRLPEISKQEIKDRGRADGFAKLFTCVQVSWMIVQCVARAAEHLPISELELTTVAYAVTALIIYCLWWDKPYDATVTLTIPFHRDPVSELRSRRFNERVPFGSQGFDLKKIWVVKTGSVAALGLTTALFGGIHCAAWNFSFATGKEREMWRVCSIMVAILPSALFSSILLSGENKDSGLWFNAASLAFFFCCIAYVAARAILLFQIFYCLRSMPQGTYTTAAWVNYIPHVG